MKIIKTATEFFSLSFRCRVKIFDTVEIPQYVKFRSTKPHIKGSLEKIGRDYGLQPELLIEELDNRFLIKVILRI